MRKILAGALTLGLLMSPDAVDAASLAGTACKSSGKTKQVKNVTYVCAKKNRTLKWQVKRTASPNPLASSVTVPAPMPAAPVPPVDLSQSPLVLKSGFSAFDACKAVDVTPRPADSQGFPRPSNALTGSSTVRILVLPFSVSDRTFTNDDWRDLKSAVASTQAFYDRVSYGKLKLEVEFAEPSQWIVMPKTADDYGLIRPRPQQNNEAFVREIVAAASPAIDFDRYDSVILEAPRWSESGGGQGFVGERFAAATGIAKRINFHWGNAAQRDATIRHELGHTLFGLEDLYMFKGYGRPFEAWDIMSGDGQIEGDFSGWNKFLIGWLTDLNVRCVETSTVLYLAPLRNPSSRPQLALVPALEGVTLAVEARFASRSATIPGALVYVVDSRIQHGEGPISSIGKLLAPGQSAETLQWRVNVLDANESGLLVSLERL